MNTKAEIGQALEDFEAGRLGTIPPNALDAPRARPGPRAHRALRHLSPGAAPHRSSSPLLLPLD